MRTQDEIVERIKTVPDFFGCGRGTLVEYLDFEHAEEFLNEEFLAEEDAADQWACRSRGTAGFQQDINRVLVRDDVIPQMRGYVAFGWGKVRNHRGLSADRTILKMKAWLWLLGDDELEAFAADYANYPQYGAPILKAICEKYDFPIPEDVTWCERCKDYTGPGTGEFDCPYGVDYGPGESCPGGWGGHSDLAQRNDARGAPHRCCTGGDKQVKTEEQKAFEVLYGTVLDPTEEQLKAQKRGRTLCPHGQPNHYALQLLPIQWASIQTSGRPGDPTHYYGDWGAGNEQVGPYCLYCKCNGEFTHWWPPPDWFPDWS